MTVISVTFWAMHVWSQMPLSSGVNPGSKPASIRSTASNAAIKSFKEWKNEKVQSAIKKVTITRAQIEYRKLNKQLLQKGEAGNLKDSEMERLELQLKNDTYSLEVAQDLTVSDYFGIYLTKQENRTDAYKDAAQKMTSDEVAELIAMFADSFFPENKPTIPRQGANVSDKIEKIK